jgi:hypothetical protein
VPGNAAQAEARIAALGYAAARKSERGLTVVMAGPFATQADVAGAVAQLRAAGFADAFAR